MVELARKRGERGDIHSEVKTRPSDIMGKGLHDRYKFLDGANKSAGKLLGKIAQDNKNTFVDVSAPTRNFLSQLREHGIQLKDGKVDFSQTDLAKADFGLIRENMGQINRILNKQRDGMLSFYDAHRLKQIIRRTGLSYEDTAVKKGASTETQNLFKSYSGQIDEVLDGKSSAYDKANIKFGDTVNELNKIKKIAKDNLFTESAETQLGLFAKRMTGNAVSRASIMDMAEGMDNIARKYGGKFDDDLITLGYVANDMDDVLGVAAKTSIKGELGAQSAQALERSSLGHAAHALDTVQRMMARQSETKALDSLEALTRSAARR